MKACNFCKKTQYEVNIIIAGEYGDICDDCVITCVQTLTEKNTKYKEKILRAINSKEEYNR